MVKKFKDQFKKKLVHKKHDVEIDLDNLAPRKKKSLGQHFLRNALIVDKMLESVDFDGKPVFEIGCGDGFLTKSILAVKPGCSKLFSVEYDKEWYDFVAASVIDSRLCLIHENILHFKFDTLGVSDKMVLLANLPYNISFPIMYLLVENKDRFSEGVFMVQEEVAQKLVATSGRDMGAVSLLMQHHFEFRLLDKVLPSSFSPPPKVLSRTVYFRTKFNLLDIEAEDGDLFWLFVKSCFHHPRQTLKNNFKKHPHLSLWIEHFDELLLSKRAQQMVINDFVGLWKSAKEKGLRFYSNIKID